MSEPASERTTDTTSSIPRWATVLAVVIGLLFTGAGIMRLLPVPFDMDLFADWGLPHWFRTIVGVGELTAGVLTVLPRTRPIGAIGVFTIMVAAGTMHVAVGHGIGIQIVINGIPALLAAVVFWMHRRRLAEL